MHKPTDSEFEFQETGEIGLGQDWIYAADTDRIAFGTADGQVEIASISGRETLKVASTLDDIDLNRYVVCLVGDDVRSYTESGVELWTQEVPNSSSVVSLRGTDVLAVLTESGTIVGLDLETGTQLFEQTFPHDDVPERQTVGGQNLVCIAAWSFLVCVDAHGRVVLDENLDSAIEDVSMLGDYAVAVLKDGRLIAVDTASGEIRWSNNASLRYLAPFGDEWLPALTDTESVLINVEGRIEPVSLKHGSRIVGSSELSVLGVTDETSVQLYRRGPPPEEQLSAGFLTDSFDAETAIRAFVENTGSNPVETTIELDSDPSLSVDTEYEQVTLAGGESKEIAYRVQELPEAADIRCQLLAEGTDLATKSVPIERQLDLQEAVVMDLVVDRIVDGRVTYVGNVENTTDMTLDKIQVADDQFTDVTQGETVTVESVSSLGRPNHTETVKVTHGNELESKEFTVDVPEDGIDLTVSQRKSEIPSLDIEVQPAVPAPVQGDITVNVLGRTVTRTLDLAENERVIFVLVGLGSVTNREHIPLQVSSSLLAEDVKEQIRGIDGGQSRTESPTGDGGAEIRKTQGTRADESLQKIQKADDPSLTIRRKAPDSVECGAKFGEKIQIQNNSDDECNDTIVSDSLGEYTIDTLAAHDVVTLRRSHAVFADDNIRLPPFEAGGATSSPATLQIVERDVKLRSQADCISGSNEVRVRFTLTNQTHRRCTVTRIGIDISPDMQANIWRLSPHVSLDPNTTKTLVRTVDIPEDVELTQETRQAKVKLQLENSDRETYQTLAPIRKQGISGEEPFTVTLLDRGKLVAGKKGIIELEVGYSGQETVSDLTLSADGDIIASNRILPASKTVGKMPPGEKKPLRPDVKPESTGTAEFDVTIEGVVNGDPITQVTTFSGPVASSPAEWEQNSYIDVWNSSSGSETQPEPVEFDTPHLVTSLRPTEGESHR